MLPNVVPFTIGCFVFAMIVWMIYRIMMHIAIWAFSIPEQKKKPSGIVRGTEGFYTGTVKEDMAAKETKKRIAAVFDEQAEIMKIRGQKAHACNDPLFCSQSPCFVVVPDKIVKKSTENKKSIEQRTQELVKSDKSAKSSLKRLKYGVDDEGR